MGSSPIERTIIGDVVEWSITAVLKTAGEFKCPRGFESHRLRQFPLTIENKMTAQTTSDIIAKLKEIQAKRQRAEREHAIGFCSQAGLHMMFPSLRSSKPKN